MAKPSGAACNLDCQYCFYLDKAALYGRGTGTVMSDAVLEAYVSQQIQGQRSSEVVFTWQGGEPTLLGVEFYEKAVALQRRHGAGRRIINAFQTNGILLDDAWGRFLQRENFLVGLSLDGPRPLHDCSRTDKAGAPTFDRVMQGLEVLKAHSVEFNTLSVVHRASARQPIEVYRFLKEAGAKYLQFIPLVERLPGRADETDDLRVAPPLQPGHQFESPPAVTPWSVEAAEYGFFLTALFDEWLREDVGKVFVQLFDVSLGIWMGRPSGLCLFSPKCGDAVALERNGDVYSCDHFVHPGFKLGNLLQSSLGELVRSPRQRLFGEAKGDRLPAFCRGCDVRFACQGECPKNRFLRAPDGEWGLNYLCAAYQRFFHHVNPVMRQMAYLALSGRAPAEIMALRGENGHGGSPMVD
jgi:uncharacterized protein